MTPEGRTESGPEVLRFIGLRDWPAVRGLYGHRSQLALHIVVARLWRSMIFCRRGCTRICNTWCTDFECLARDSEDAKEHHAVR